MLKDINNESKKVGLYLNASKTKILTNGEPCYIKIDDTNIETVKEYIYLGQLVSFDNSTQNEIQRRIALGWRKYWSLKELMKNNQIDIKIKTKLYNIVILPTLTYGCQTWALRKEDENKLAICQRKMERSMLGIKLQDKINNKTIRKKTKIYDINNKIRQLKWQWAGHVCRLDNKRWTKKITEWIPRDCTRSKGRQRVRWADTFTKICEGSWMTKARDRQKWKIMGEAYAAEATTTQYLINYNFNNIYKTYNTT